ncbi:Asp23/Gls24 family envelope stress response protein [Kineococcus sp. SYSU DK005]|uniref:Asp23/Gls24 family envelope stress response protein n=1 Tax=Kineococcus sp. SYSU DK005 TaxID=3383126 RepID=UPI003D7D9758
MADRTAAEPRAALHRADPGQRGRLTVADRVAQRLAQAAAAEVPGSVRTDRDRSGGGVGAAVGSAVGGALGRAYPSADCTLAGNRVRVRVRVAAAWPVPAPDLAARVREQVTGRLTRLGGLVVDACDVTVATYVHEVRESRRVQ